MKESTAPDNENLGGRSAVSDSGSIESDPNSLNPPTTLNIAVGIAVSESDSAAAGPSQDSNHEEEDDDDLELMKVVESRSRAASLSIRRASDRPQGEELELLSDEFEDGISMTKLVERQLRDDLVMDSKTKVVTKQDFQRDILEVSSRLPPVAPIQKQEQVGDSADKEAHTEGPVEPNPAPILPAPGRLPTPEQIHHYTQEAPNLRRHHDVRDSHHSQPGAYAHAPREGAAAPNQNVPTFNNGSNNNGGTADAPHNITNNHGLVEATPLQPDNESRPLDLEQANAIDPELLNRLRETQRQKNNLVLMTGLVACVCMVFGIAIGIVLAVVVSRNDDPSDTTPTITSLTMQPTGNPSAIPSQAPSSPLYLMLDALPPHTLESLQDPLSPQAQAYNWLLTYQNITGVAEWRKLQLFALATFFYSFEGPHWVDYAKEDWLLDTKNECFWHSGSAGYYSWGDDDTFTDTTWIIDDGTFEDSPCNQKGEFQILDLLQLDLGEHNATASIPPEIALLTSLKEIRLNRNEQVGPLLQILPTELYEMTQLKDLDFSSNKIGGPIPSELGLLSSVTNLELWENSFTGNLPTQLGQMSMLQVLDLSFLSMASKIPSQMGLLENLSEFHAFWSSFSGMLPTELGSIPGLTLVNFWANSLTGSLPTELGLATNMETAFLQQNVFTGTIPTEVGMWENLREVVLRENLLTGTLPTQLGKLTNMVLGLYLEGNSFTGSLPTELGLITSLSKLDVSQNLLVHHIPSELGSLALLEQMYTTENALSGAIPSELGLLESLAELKLDSNNLSMSIPTELGLLGVLRRLNLGSNPLLSGMIPTWLVGLSELRELRLSNLPSLTGSIPIDIGSMVNMNLSGVDITGSSNLTGVLPEELCFLESGIESCNYTLTEGRWEPTVGCGLEFDCSPSLCGCNCTC